MFQVPLTDYDACKYTSVPVTETGEVGSKLLGIVTSRDADFILDRSKLVSEVMVPVDKLVCGTQGLSLEEANTMIKQSKKGKLPVIDQRGRLTALVSRADILKNREYPLALKETLGDSTPRNRPRIDSQGSYSGSEGTSPARSPPSPAREVRYGFLTTRSLNLSQRCHVISLIHIYTTHNSSLRRCVVLCQMHQSLDQAYI